MQSLAAPAASTRGLLSSSIARAKQRPLCACNATPLPRSSCSSPAVATAAASSSSPRQLVAGSSQQHHQRRRRQPCAASGLGSAAAAAAAPRTSLDPMAASWSSDSWESGRLLTIKSPQQFEAVSKAHPDRLFVLMCKSHSCRPCKMFTRKYLSVVSGVLCCVSTTDLSRRGGAFHNPVCPRAMHTCCCCTGDALPRVHPR
jgi:hypothetical protein